MNADKPWQAVLMVCTSRQDCKIDTVKDTFFPHTWDCEERY